MSSLALYRALIPAHAMVPDATVTVWLEQAATAHDASKWGAVYGQAMVWWVADGIDPLVTAGLVGATVTGCNSAVATTAVVATREDRPYWDRYQALLRSRAAGAPGVVTPAY